MYACMQTHTHTHAWDTSVYTHVYVHTCIRVHIHVHVHIVVNVSICAYIYICAYICIHGIRKHVDTQIYMYMYTQTCIYVHKSTQTYVRMHSMPVCMYVCVPLPVGSSHRVRSARHATALYHRMHSILSSLHSVACNTHQEKYVSGCITQIHSIL